MTRKLVLLHKRRAGTAVDAFHAALAAACEDDAAIAGLTRYVQSHTLVQGYRKGELLFDAVEEFSFASRAAAADFLAGPAFAAVRGRRAALVDPAAGIVMAVDVHRVKNQPVPLGAVKNIEFVNRRPTVALSAFRRYWREVHGPLGATIPSMLRYEQNHLAPEAYLPDEPAPRFDGLAITWFASTAAMRAGAETQAYALTRADEAAFLPDGHLPIIITREVLER
ncbi:EthD domain-containing protein [Xanthobacter sp. V3C-3]|uniref:EthD domain-containing protein n=1 Tax=Xanthobacter lutulentifluminis TaxID=3119935 RepID=UPI0037299730